MKTNRMKKILVVTLSNIGDAILTTPVLEALHQYFPEATIDLVCDPRSAALFTDCPYRGQLFLKNKKDGCLGYFRLISALRQQHYDVAVDLKTDFLLHFILAKQKFHKISANSMLEQHSVIKHLSALQTLLPRPTFPPVKLWAHPENAEDVMALQQMLQTKRYLALGLGANFSGKIWPAEQYAALVNLLTLYFDAVLLLGDTRDRSLSAVFNSRVNLPVTDCCGILNLPQSFSLLTHAKYFIGNDSGLGHMAAAAGVPTFTIFGPGAPHRYLPWSKKSHFYQDPQHQILNVTVAQVAPRVVAAMLSSGFSQ